MSDLGTILLNAGLITRAELDKALHLRHRLGGRLGPILVSIGAASQEHIDAIWRESQLLPPLEAAIDRTCMNRFTAHIKREVAFTRIQRHDIVTEDMLNGSELIGASVRVDGQATLRIGDMESPPIRFELETETRLCTLDDASEVTARRWVEMVDRKLAESSPNAGQRSAVPTGVPEGFEAALQAALKNAS